MAATLARPAAAGPTRAVRTPTRVCIVFEGRLQGARAVARLQAMTTGQALDVELVALAVPDIRGGLRVHLGGDRATEYAVAAAQRALDELGGMLVAQGVACRTRIAQGTLAHALRAALQDTGADLCIVATGWPRWRIAWLLRGTASRGSLPPARMLVV